MRLPIPRTVCVTRWTPAPTTLKLKIERELHAPRADGRKRLQKAGEGDRSGGKNGIDLCHYPGDFASGSELWRALDRYFHFYNHQRPHPALGYRTPADLFPPRSKRKAPIP